MILMELSSLDRAGEAADDAPLGERKKPCGVSKSLPPVLNSSFARPVRIR
ncbi:hypothetical protein [Solihabitans fulvus]|nr:hypothetical protein [Solihabitans fulvus]